MGRSVSMKKRRARKIKNRKPRAPLIASAPREMVAEVLVRVAASSSTDFFRAKLCCKVLHEIAEDDNNIYKCISLEKIPIVPWTNIQQILAFSSRCKDCGNPEALYRQGVINYLGCKEADFGVKCLMEAANEGHDGALYALAIGLLFEEDGLKQEGIQLLSGMMKKSRKIVRESRQKLKEATRPLWKIHPLFSIQKPTCCEHNRVTMWSPADEDLKCDACNCDQEVALLRL